MTEFTIEVKTEGDFTEQELKDYIIFQVRGGGINPGNAFISEDEDAEITDCEVY